MGTGSFVTPCSVSVLFCAAPGCQSLIPLGSVATALLGGRLTGAESLRSVSRDAS